MAQPNIIKFSARELAGYGFDLANNSVISFRRSALGSPLQRRPSYKLSGREWHHSRLKAEAVNLQSNATPNQSKTNTLLKAMAEKAVGGQLPAAGAVVHPRQPATIAIEQAADGGYPPFVLYVINGATAAEVYLTGKVSVEDAVARFCSRQGVGADNVALALLPVERYRVQRVVQLAAM